MAGLEKLLKSLLKYQSTLKPHFMRRLADVQNDPSVLKGLMFSCMDARVNVSSVLSQELGESFHVRNAGNFIPHSSTISSTCISAEPAALELACLVKNVPDVVVFGHSDCKAMIGLRQLEDPSVSVEGSPLMTWIQKHGVESLAKYQDFVKKGEPLTFREAHQSFEAVIDPKLPPDDQLSQINTLQQLENISSYPFLVERLMNGSLKTHAVWLDLLDADVLVFNRNSKKFDVVTQKNLSEFV